MRPRGLRADVQEHVQGRRPACDAARRRKRCRGDCLAFPARPRFSGAQVLSIRSLALAPAKRRLGSVFVREAPPGLSFSNRRRSSPNERLLCCLDWQVDGGGTFPAARGPGRRRRRPEEEEEAVQPRLAPQQHTGQGPFVLLRGSGHERGLSLFPDIFLCCTPFLIRCSPQESNPPLHINIFCTGPSASPLSSV